MSYIATICGIGLICLGADNYLHLERINGYIYVLGWILVFIFMVQSIIG